MWHVFYQSSVCRPRALETRVNNPVRQILNKLSLILLMSLATAGAFAQGTGGVTMSTDPAKAAAVEQHAQELRARQPKETQSKPAAKSTSTKKSKGKTSTTHKSSTKKPAKATKS